MGWQVRQGPIQPPPSAPRAGSADRPDLASAPTYSKRQLGLVLGVGSGTQDSWILAPALGEEGEVSWARAGRGLRINSMKVAVEPRRNESQCSPGPSH